VARLGALHSYCDDACLVQKIMAAVPLVPLSLTQFYPDSIASPCMILYKEEVYTVTVTSGVTEMIFWTTLNEL